VVATTDNDFGNAMTSMPQSRNRLKNERSKDDEVSGGIQ